MSMTEDQARELRCCGNSHCGALRTVQAEGDQIIAERYCIASQCMAWNWDEGVEDGRTEGGCGLAGQP